MDDQWWIAPLLCLCFASRGYSVTLEIIPDSQKVVENSPVIFTCVSSEDDGEFTWYRSGKLVDEEKDEVKIKQIDDYKSVLKVDRADIRKHKKTFKCLFTGEDGMFAEASVSLKVMSSSRAHKYFPHIKPIRGGNDVMQQAPPGQLKLKCSTVIEHSQQLPTWRWIKDDFVDLSLTEDFMDGKMTISGDGELLIKDVAGEDSGMYMCVAENNRGSAYSTAFRVSIVQDPAGFSGCVDEDGYRSEIGETYKQSDICTTCSCEEGGILRCRSVSCYPYCPEGMMPKMSEEECCVYECIDQERHSRTDDGDTCVDMNGKVINDGETYAPDPSDPCKTCTCDDGKEKYCRLKACLPPNCRGYILQPGTCCSFICPDDITPPAPALTSDMCVDRDGKSVKSGESYMPEEDPCLECICNNGRRERCIMVACKAPECEHFLPSRDVCCEVTCLDVPPLPNGIGAPAPTNDMCVDRDGRQVRSGDRYLPEEDPCLECICNNGMRGMCTMVACKAPKCANFIPSRDVCCEVTCQDVPPLPRGIEGSCLDYHKKRVAHGDIYQPGHDPCEMCQCTKNGPELCNQLICDAPTCRNYVLIPGTCCGFTCPDDEPAETVTINIDGSCMSYDGRMVPQGAMYNPTFDKCYTCTCQDGKPVDCDKKCITDIMYPPTLPPPPSVIGRVVIQQAGTNDAIVQWNIPKGYEEKSANITVHYHDLSTHQHHSIPVHEDNHVILRGLQLNTMYDVTVNGTIGFAVYSAIPKPYRFSLQPGYTSLSLNNALGQVFISRGSILADGYSLPREFEPVTRASGVDTLLNVRSFHMAEVSRYNEAPCPDQDCGLIRFYIYDISGQAQNVVSLMFTSHQDFVWAKSHM